MDADALQKLFEEANRMLEAGQPAETLARLEPLDDELLDDDDRIECASLQAWALSDLGRHNAAIDLIEPLLEQYPKSSRLYGTLGVILSNEGDLAGARDALNTAMRLDPDDDISLANLGLVHEKLYDFKKALELYEKAIRLGAEIDWLLPRCGHVQAELGDRVRARATLSRYLSLAPEDGEVWLALAVLHCDDSQFDQAYKCYEAAAGAMSDRAAVHLNWGVTAVRAGDLDAARAQVEKLREIEPESSRAGIVEAFLLEAEGRFAETAEAYDRALQTAAARDHEEYKYAIEMAMDFHARRADRARCEELFRAAYAHNACTVELCESYREVAGQPRDKATWFSLLIEAAYRQGLSEVYDEEEDEQTPPPPEQRERYLRNVQVVATDRDDAVDTATRLLERMGEREISVREFLGDEAMERASLGLYEIERDALILAREPD